ncbi:11166_t:CDS:2, partial [Scutellospora calospora]
MPIASIRISKGSKVIHRWYIHLIPYEMSIRDLFVKLTTRELSQECNIDTIDPETIERIEIKKVNHKQKLRSDIIDWIQYHSSRSSTQSYTNTQGKQFVACLTEAIWYIDMRDYQKFEERFLHHQHEITASNHASETPIKTVDHATTIQVHKRNIQQPVDLEELLPTNPV